MCQAEYGISILRKQMDDFLPEADLHSPQMLTTYFIYPLVWSPEPAE